MRKSLIATMVLFVITNTVFAQNKEERKQLKEEKAQTEYAEMKALLETNNFIFEANRANPTGVRSLTLNGSYSLALTDGNVNAYLPYFGRAYTAIAFGGNGGIEIDNVASNYELKFNDKKRNATITFNSQGKNERFGITITVQRNGSASLTVNSLNRSSINFNGTVKKAPADIAL